jgi:hypothetical protein
MRLIDTETGKVLWAKRDKGEYSSFIFSDHDRPFNTMTDQEMSQEVIKQLGYSLSEALYPHYEMQY